MQRIIELICCISQLDSFVRKHHNCVVFYRKETSILAINRKDLLMKKLKDIKYVEFIERILKWNYMPFIIFGCFTFILHFRFTGMFADDIWFSDILRAGNYNILTYSLWRYESWTSRTILEAMVLLGVNMPAFL